MRGRAFVRGCARALAAGVWPAAAAAILTLAVPAIAGAQIIETIGIRAQGMSGAFVAVADDATATWWNPAGLSGGGFVNLVLELDRTEESSQSRARAFAVTIPSLGLSYYRLSLNGIRPFGATEPPEGDRKEEGALNQFGITVGQSVGERLVVASTLKLVHALDETEGDLDVGAMGLLGPIRVGLSAKNLRKPDFTNGAESIALERAVRAGVSYGTGRGSGGPAPSAELIVAVDGDLTTTPTPFGDERHLAVGAEGWVLNKSIGVRGGVGMNTVGATRRSGSVGLSLAIRSGIYAEGQLTRGDDEARNGWGAALRVTF